MSKLRVGIIPYVIKDDTVFMAFMIPSDPAYGGERPQIAKGRIDHSEFPTVAAIREGEEELGLKQGNIIGNPWIVAEEQIQGQYSSYPLRVYAVQVRDQEDFNTPHYETKEVVWLTATDYMMVGREEQESFVMDVPLRLILDI